MAALEMLVCQNAAADDGQVGIRAEEIVRELLDERKQLIKRRAVNDHRRVLGVHHDRVLIVIDIRRILEAPRLAVDRDRHDAEILPCRVRDRARVADVFDAEQALRVGTVIDDLTRKLVCACFQIINAHSSVALALPDETINFAPHATACLHYSIVMTVPAPTNISG